jgi:hypothetical protein
LNERGNSAWQAWVGAAAFLLLIVVALLLKRPAPEPERPAPPPPAKARPVAPPPLDRAGLIAAAGRAANAWAIGAPPPDPGLAGRSFELRLPFGCAGPSDADPGVDSTGWRYDPETQTLRVTAALQTFTEAPLLAAIAAGAEFETAEGFWIERPWILADTCPRPVPAPLPPPAAAADAPVAPAADKGAGPAEVAADGSGEQAPTLAPAADPPVLGIVELSVPGAPRARRRDGQAYQLVRRIAPAELQAGQGFRLAISGRIEALPGRGAIGCHAATPDRRPRCLIFARIGRVAIENGTTGEVLAEWE